jgi:hypothetical protein
MKQKHIFLFICMIFVVGAVFSQNTHAKTGSLLFTRFEKKPANTALLFFNNNHSEPVKSYLPADFYTTQIGFFCRQEIKFEKLTKIPFRFRLGSMEQCDRMEGKENTR